MSIPARWGTASSACVLLTPTDGQSLGSVIGVTHLGSIHRVMRGLHTQYQSESQLYLPFHMDRHKTCVYK